MNSQMFSKQNGQVLILSVFFMLITSIAIAMLFNTAQTSTEKTRLVNAADAAAYSGAVFMSRNLNFMAYTNRAMIANHVVVGHLVSYISWLRYVKDSSVKLSRISRYIPYAGEALELVKQAVKTNVSIAEKITPVLIKSIDQLNTTIHSAQKNVTWSMNGVLSIGGPQAVKIMNTIARKYDASIRINHPGDLKVDGYKSKEAIEQVYSDLKKIFSFMKKYTVNNDQGQLTKMIGVSYGGSVDWIKGNRGWSRKFLVIKMKKNGYSEYKQNNKLAEWNARDSFTFKIFSWRGWRNTNLGKGRATSSEFDSNYSGVAGYYGLKDTDKNKKISLNISAFATMLMDKKQLSGILGIDVSAARLSTLSRAEIYYSRPVSGFERMTTTESPNLYNPFWRARLTNNEVISNVY